MASEWVVPVVTAGIAMVVFVVGDRLRPNSWKQDDEGAAGSLVHELVSTFFAAVVAFVVVIAWQNYDNARNHTVAEAKALIDTYWVAHGMPEPEHRQIQDLVRDYTTQVVNTEWSVMDREGTLSQQTQDTLDTLRDKVGDVKSDEAEAAATNLDAVAQARHDREMDVRAGIPGFLYGTMWFSMILLLFSPVLSGVGVTRRSVLMIALLGVVVGTVLFAIRNLDEPFSGGTVVSKEPFQHALTRFQQIS